jgi:hypothetical protein
LKKSITELIEKKNPLPPKKLEVQLDIKRKNEKIIKYFILIRKKISNLL